MLGAARVGKGGLLPRAYEISSARNASPGAVGRHYAGDAHARFVDDGVKRVTPHLFASDVPEP
jgi:hypothetical protein